MFRERAPLAWTYHRNTSRWAFNMHPGGQRSPDTASFKEHLDAPLIGLPDPALPEMTLGDAIRARSSCRQFEERDIPVTHLATLLAAAYGTQSRFVLGDSEFIERPVPSGGALYPLELYVLAHRVEGIESGVYHYAPMYHALEQLQSMPLPKQFVTTLFMDQPYVAQAAVVVVIAAVVERTSWKYGDRGYRYIMFEAGHVAQNLNLVATALDLGSVNTGGFFDSDLGRLIGLPEEEEVPLYGVAIGAPSHTDRLARRQPLETPDAAPHDGVIDVS